MPKKTNVKIAIVAASAPPYSSGGVASAHFNLFRALQRAGYDARFFTFGDYGHHDTKEIVRHGTPDWVLKLIWRANRLFFNFLDFGKKAYQMRDIVASLWGSRQMSKEIHAYGPDVIILSDHGAPGLMLKKPDGAKVVLISHHNPARFVRSKFSEFSARDARWAVDLEQKALEKVDAVVCPTTYMKRWFEKTYKFSGPKLVIHNIVDSRTLFSVRPSNLRTKMSLRKSDKLIYMPSAGDRLKGGGQVLDIISRLTHQSRNVAFYISGNLPVGLKDHYLRLRPRPMVCWGGQLPYAQNLANVKACSFGISPSLMENYSMAILEAVHSGVPMIAFNIGGNSEIIRSGKNGYLVREGDSDALISKAIQLLRANNLANLRRKALAFRKKQHPQKAFDAYVSLIQTI